MRNKSTLPRPTHLCGALAHAAVLLLASPLGHGAVTVSGPYHLDPWDPAPLGPGDINLPGSRLYLGNGAPGSFAATAGSQVRLAKLSLANSQGSASGLLDGAGTRLELHGSGFDNRFELGNFGTASFTVAGGAVLDGRANLAACLDGPRFCNNFIGHTAGSDAILTITGAGSRASFAHLFSVGRTFVGASDGSFGVSGGTTNGRVEVLDGGLLETDWATVGDQFVAHSANGSERGIGAVRIQGPGSLWRVSGNSLGANNGGAYFDLAQGQRSEGLLEIVDGGQLRIEAAAGRDYGLRLGHGGQAQASVSGPGSVLSLQGDAERGYFHIGENAGTGDLLVSAGGLLSGGRWNNVGINGGRGLLTVRDHGSLAEFLRGDLNVGYRADGTLAVLNGGVLRAQRLAAAAGDGAAQGWVLVRDAGSRIELSAAGSRLSVGDWGQGVLTVSGGALLDATVNAASCLGFLWCDSFIGNAAGSKAQFTISGAGSEARFLDGLVIGNVHVATQAKDGWTYGTPGGFSEARVWVLGGGVLRTERAYLGGFASSSGTGGERSFAEVLVSGAGSQWWVSGNAAGGEDAGLNVGTHRLADGRIRVEAGGYLGVVAQPGRGAALDLSAGSGPGQGGASLLEVDGAGSRVDIGGEQMSRLVVGNNSGGTARLVVRNGALLQQSSPHHSYLNIGEAPLGSGSGSGAVEILSGGRMLGARHVNVGSGGQGSLLIDGAGSLLSTDRNGSAVGQLNVGLAGSGALTVRNGGMASAFALQIGSGYGGDSGSVLLDGAGSRIELDALDWHRLSIANGALTVSGGAVLDAAVNAATCTGHWCGSFLANNAGDEAKFVVTGAGSRASFLGGFNIGQSHVTAPPHTEWSSGRPGGISRVELQVLNGGRLETEGGRIAQGPSGGAASGSEGVQALVRVSGAGSVWDVRGGPEDGGVASIIVGYGSGVAANTQSDIQILNGGRIHLHSDLDHAAQLNLGLHGGLHSLRISGAGSALSYGETGNGGLWIGRNGALASVALSEGGQIQGLNRIQVGNTGSIGRLSVMGATSGIAYGSFFADLLIGRQGGHGSAEIGGGAQVQMHADHFSRLFVGDNTGAGVAAGSGSLNLSGAGTLLSLRSGLDGVADSSNPYVVIGRSASGDLRVRGGAVLRLEGLAPAGPQTYYEGAGMVVGHGWDGPSSGRLDVSGAGSRLDMLGTNPFITVGDGPKGSGQLTISAGAELRSTLMGIADFGASGSTLVDNATLRLNGAWRSGVTIGASLGIGNGSGSVGTLSLLNGARLIVENPAGDTGTNLGLGGLPGFAEGGSGLLSLAGGSRVEVGLDAGHGQVLIGATAGGIGIATLDGASRIDTDYLGVGAFYGADAGVGTLIVNGDSVVSAGQIEIGARGFVGGTGTLVGNILNRGVFSPGNSPGTLTIDGAFVNAAGGRIELEVASDGQGGFLTDRLLFADGAALDLGALQIEFRFLGATDPNAFQASGGFKLGSFFATRGGAALDPALFAGASYGASADAYVFQSFSFTADGGATFSAAPVPEPGQWLLLLAGLAMLTGWSRRRCVRG